MSGHVAVALIFLSNDWRSDDFKRVPAALASSSVQVSQSFSLHSCVDKSLDDKKSIHPTRALFVLRYHFADSINMKFCKSLQRVVEISDPAYSAFFVNYRMLSKSLQQTLSHKEMHFLLSR